MTRDEGVALIKQQLAFRSTLDSEIVSNMLLAQVTLELAPVKPWFLVSEDSFTTTTVSEERIPVPLDFTQEVEDATFKYRPDGWPDEPEVDLIKDEYDVLRRNYREREAGPPEAYALVGEYFRIFPLPDAVYTLRLIYHFKDTLLTTNIENRWLKHVPLLLLGSAGQLIAAGPIRDTVASAQFEKWISLGMKVMSVHNESREMANRAMQMGGPSA